MTTEQRRGARFGAKRNTDRPDRMSYRGPPNEPTPASFRSAIGLTAKGRGRLAGNCVFAACNGFIARSPKRLRRMLVGDAEPVTVEHINVDRMNKKNDDHRGDRRF